MKKHTIESIVELANKACNDDKVKLCNGQICVAAMKDITNLLKANSKFKIGDYVKVQVFNVITKGYITHKKTYEDIEGIVVKYSVDFGNDFVEAWEEDLVYAQTMKVGDQV